MPEQRLLITERTEISQTLPAVGEHHREITDHAAVIVPGSTLLEVPKPRRQGAPQPGLLGDLGQQHAADVRDQTLSIRHDIYLETAAIALHPQGEPPELGNKVSTTPILQAQPDIPRPRPPGARTVNQKAGLASRGDCSGSA
jgi:hypothetical protein